MNHTMVKMTAWMLGLCLWMSVARAGEDFSAIDQYALSTPAYATSSIPVLAKYLTQVPSPAITEIEKARVIYRWVTANLTYDLPALLNNDPGPDDAYSPEEILAKRIVVCAGYAKLYHALAQAAGLNSEYVEGWLRGGPGYHVGDSMPDLPNHAWNMITLNGKQYFVDATLGGGGIGANSAWVRDFHEEFFMISPQEFIYSHLPYHDQDQALKQTITMQQFVHYPFIQQKFFQFGFTLNPALIGVLAIKDSGIFTMPANENMNLMAQLYQGDVLIPGNWVLVQLIKNQYQIQVQAPKAGNYELRLYAGYKGKASQMMSQIITYKIVASAASKAGGYPQVYGPLYDLGLSIPSLPGTLNINNSGSFSLAIPRNIALIADLRQNGTLVPGNWVTLEPGADQYKVNFKAPASGTYTLVLYAKRKEDPSQSYLGVLAYTIVAGAGSVEPPLSTPLFQELGMSLAALPGTLTMDHSSSINIPVPDTVELAADLRQNGTLVPGNWALIGCGSGQCTVRFMTPAAGTYSLVLYARRRDNTSAEFSSVLVYTIVASSGADASFPKMFAMPRGTQLQAPLMGVLQSGVPYDFQVVVPGAAKVAVMLADGTTWVPLKSGPGGVFYGRVDHITRGQVALVVQLAGSTDDSASVIAEYTVQ